MNFINKIFKKEKVEEVYEEINRQVPDIMMPESSSKVNLMDPETIDIVDLMKPPTINNEDIIVIEKGNNLNESPGIENQLTDNIIMDIPKFKEKEVVVPLTDAFNMTPEIEEPVLETLDMSLQKTQKFCPECGTANDVLNKFCVSCGYNFS